MDKVDAAGSCYDEQCRGRNGDTEGDRDRGDGQMGEAERLAAITMSSDEVGTVEFEGIS